MTREEAIEVLRRLPIGLMDLSCEQKSDLTEALNIALAALRGPTREQVEKVWKGEWINKQSAYDHKIFTCAQCGKQISIQGENLDFCPKCGSTQTDEAVEITLQRLEVLYEIPTAT